jgi:hypothetical protein
MSNPKLPSPQHHLLLSPARAQQSSNVSEAWQFHELSVDEKLSVVYDESSVTVAEGAESVRDESVELSESLELSELLELPLSLSS